MDIKDIIGFLLRFLIPVIGLALVFLPLWYVGWKMAKKSWWHYIATIPAMAGILVGLDYLLTILDRWVYNNVYDSHAILDGISDGNIFLILLVGIFTAISPLIYIKKIYLRFNWKNLIFGILAVIILFIVEVIIVAYYIVAGLGQIGQKYF